MIKIKAIEPRDENRQTAYFTIDDIEFSCGGIPANLSTQASIKAYLESRADEFRLILLKKQYPGAKCCEYKTEENTELEAMEEWITKGHKNKVLTGFLEESPTYEDQIIEKVELEYKHPKWIGLLEEIEASNVNAEIKNLLKKIIKL